MNTTNNRFASLAERLTPIVDEQIPDATARLLDEEAIVDAMSGWAQLAVEEGLESLPAQPDFGPFWRALEQDPELGELWATLVDEALLARERRHTTASPVTSADVELAWHQQVHGRHMQRLLETAGDQQHPDRVTAAGALCQYAETGDLMASNRLEELASRHDGLAALWTLWRDARHPDSQAVRTVMPKIVAQVAAHRGRDLAAGALGAFERALLAAMVRLELLLPQGTAQFTPSLASGLSGSATTGQLLRSESGPRGAIANFELDSNGFVQTIRLRLKGLQAWSGAALRILFDDVDALERLAAQGASWDWVEPGEFVADQCVSAAGELLVTLGVSTDDALTIGALYDAMPGGIRTERLDLHDLPSADPQTSGC